MSRIEKLIEKKEQLELEIKEKQKEEYEKFGRWFLNKVKVTSSAEAKKIANDLFELEEINNQEIEENNSYNNENNTESINPIN